MIHELHNQTIEIFDIKAAATEGGCILSFRCHYNGMHTFATFVPGANSFEDIIQEIASGEWEDLVHTYFHDAAERLSADILRDQKLEALDLVVGDY